MTTIVLLVCFCIIYSIIIISIIEEVNLVYFLFGLSIHFFGVITIRNIWCSNKLFAKFYNSECWSSKVNTPVANKYDFPVLFYDNLWAPPAVWIISLVKKLISFTTISHLPLASDSGNDKAMVTPCFCLGKSVNKHHVFNSSVYSSFGFKLLSKTGGFLQLLFPAQYRM